MTSLRATALIALLLPAAAPAAERSVYVASFDKVRVLGPFEVRIAHDRPAGAALTGEGRVIDTVEVQVDGSTLTIRNRIGRWEEQPRALAAAPVVVTVGAPAEIVAASVIGGGRLAIDRMKGARLDLTVTGAGSIAVGAATADAADATLIGNGAITLAGRTGTARLMTNGAGTIDAAAFDVGDLVVRLDGPGTTRARARYTARVTDTGLGQVTVAGSPKCTVAASAGGPVTCGSQG